VPITDDPENAILQLGGRLLGEGKRDNVPRLYARLTEHLRDSLRNNLCLARTRTCNNL
jgi:hypothetical protein